MKNDLNTMVTSHSNTWIAIDHEFGSDRRLILYTLVLQGDGFHYQSIAENDWILVLTELRGLIDSARQHVAQAANAALTMLYWHVGQRIRQEVLKDQRAGYGEEILPTLSAKLVRDYGQGFNARNLACMIQFAEAFSDEQIVATLSRQLSWSHRKKGSAR